MTLRSHPLLQAQQYTYQTEPRFSVAVPFFWPLTKHVVVKYFDQELFGIQQAMLESAYVFCSKTLTQGYLQAGLLKELNTQAIDSAFCYYIENKQKNTTRHTHMFIEWLDNLML